MNIYGGGEKVTCQNEKRRRNEEVMVHDHTWSIQQCNTHEYDNAHDDYENVK